MLVVESSVGGGTIRRPINRQNSSRGMVPPPTLLPQRELGFPN